MAEKFRVPSSNCIFELSDAGTLLYIQQTADSPRYCIFVDALPELIEAVAERKKIFEMLQRNPIELVHRVRFHVYHHGARTHVEQDWIDQADALRLIDAAIARIRKGVI